MNEQADVQQTFSLAEALSIETLSKLESLLDIHLKTALYVSVRMAERLGY